MSMDKVEELKKKNLNKCVGDYSVQVNGLPLDETPAGVRNFFMEDEILDNDDSEKKRRNLVVKSVSFGYYVGPYIRQSKRVENIRDEIEKCRTKIANAKNWINKRKLVKTIEEVKSKVVMELSDIKDD